MSPILEGQPRHDKKRRHVMMEERYKVLRASKRVEKDVKQLSSRKSHKRARSRTISISSSSSVSSYPSNFPHDNRNKKRLKSGNKHCHRESRRSQSPGKNCDVTIIKINSEPTPIRREIKEEKIDEYWIGVNGISSGKVASIQDDRSMEIKREIKVEDLSLSDEKKEDEMVHKLLSAKWSEILRNGLPEEIKDEHSVKYRLTKNYKFLKAPSLNTYLDVFLNEKYIKSDQREVSTQNRLSLALVAIDKVLSAILSPLVWTIDPVDVLVDAGIILAGIHHSFSIKRRFDITSAFDLDDIADVSSVENSLFSEQFLNILKSAKLLGKPVGNVVQPLRGEDNNGAKNLEDTATNKDTKNSKDKTGNNAKTCEDKTNSGEKITPDNLNEDEENLVKKANDGTKNCEEKIINSANDSKDKTKNGAKNSEKKNNDVQISEEKTGTGTKNIEKASNGTKNSEEIGNNSGKTLEEKNNDTENLKKNTANSSENSTNKPNNSAINPVEKTNKAAKSPGEKKDIEDKINNASRISKKKITDGMENSSSALKTCPDVEKKKVQEKDASQSEAEQQIPKESRPLQAEQKSLNESAEDLLVNLKNASLRIIDEITAVYQKRIDALQPGDTQCKAEIKVAKGSEADEPFPGVQEAFKRTNMAKGYSEAAAKTIIQCLAPSTMKNYERPLRFWWNFCAKRNINVYAGTVQNVMQFFVEHESVFKTHTVLELWRAALGEFTIDDLGKSRSIANYVKGIKKNVAEKNAK